jgi:hypothetical protein
VESSTTEQIKKLKLKTCGNEEITKGFMSLAGFLSI